MSAKRRETLLKIGVGVSRRAFPARPHGALAGDRRMESAERTGSTALRAESEERPAASDAREIASGAVGRDAARESRRRIAQPRRTTSTRRSRVGTREPRELHEPHAAVADHHDEGYDTFECRATAAGDQASLGAAGLRNRNRSAAGTNRGVRTHRARRARARNSPSRCVSASCGFRKPGGARDEGSCLLCRRHSAFSACGK